MEDIQLNLTPLAPLETAPIELTVPNPVAEGPAGADMYVPEQVCAKMIHYAVEDHKLTHVSFVGGCEGNFKAIAALIEGMDIDQVVDKLSGITCGNKPTSCADQLCNALRGHMGA